MTAEQVQIRRDTAANLNAATPAAGELGYDTTNKRIVIGDGSTAGGIRIPSAKDLQNQAFIAGTVGGTADVITLTNSPVVLSYANPQRFTFKAGGANTGAVTVNVDGLGAKNVLKMSGGSLGALAAGNIVSGGVYDIFYDGTQFQIKGLDETVTTGGTTLQVVEALSSTATSGGTIIPYDNTIPQNTEGQEFTQAACAVTPISASSTLIIDVWAHLDSNATGSLVAALFVDSTASALMAGGARGDNVDSVSLIHFSYKVASASTSARTYKLRYGGTGSSPTFFINRSSGGAKYGGVMKSGIRVTEILI